MHVECDRVLAVGLILVLSFGCSRSHGTSVTFDPIPPAGFPGAIADGALSRVCAPSEATLHRAFFDRRLPVQPNLIQRLQGLYCHIWYEPSVPGFRASPEDARIRGLLISLSAPAFFSQRPSGAGDGLDLARQLLPRIARDLDVTLVTASLGGTAYRAALRYHFPNSIHRFGLHSPSGESYNPWAQDYLKAGYAGSSPRVLVTRRAFEGSVEMGADMQPVLDSFATAPFVRSKLSWEGGDLQFVRHPRDSSKTVLVYGTTAKRYWGQQLTAAEFDYALRQEFGADTSLYLGDATPHVDYAAMFLPVQRIALVSREVLGDKRLALAALAILRTHYGRLALKEIRDLEEAMRDARPDPASFTAAVDQARQALEIATASLSPGSKKMEDYVTANCPGDPSHCFKNDAIARILPRRAGVVREWVEGLDDRETEALLSQRMLDVILRQMQTETEPSLLEEAAKQIEQLGFRVIRVPLIRGAIGTQRAWAGLSYANSVLVDGDLFVPKFGFGEIEDGWLRSLGESLGSAIRVHPVHARSLLLANGGLHCALAVIRDP